MAKKTRSKVKVSQSLPFPFSFQTELSQPQKLAWVAYQKQDLLFLLGPAGVGKTHIAVSFAIFDLLNKDVARNKIVITRPIVESGESLGYLPGTFEEKVNPYMMPIYDCLHRITGPEGKHKEKVMNSLEVCPLAYMRGRSFSNSIFIFDEAQNASKDQLKLAISRLGENSKMIITGDPDQSDLPDCVLDDVATKIMSIQGVGAVKFKESAIMRHPLVGKILKKI